MKRKIDFKVRCKNGNYRIVASGVNTVDRVLGYVNGAPLVIGKGD